MPQVTTGITGLDSQLGGGFPTGTTILSLSEPSTAPLTLNEQFAAGGLNAGDTVYYYSLERPKQEVIDHVKNFITKDIKAKIVFFDSYSVKLKSLNAAALKRLGVTNHGVNVTEDVIPRMLAEEAGSHFRVVVESLTEVASAYGEAAAMKMVESVTGVSRMLDGVTLLGLTRGLTDPKFEIRVRHLVDGVLEFGIDRQGFGLYPYVSITKMRGVSDAAKLLLYKETEKGLWLESTRRVF